MGVLARNKSVWRYSGGHGNFPAAACVVGRQGPACNPQLERRTHRLYKDVGDVLLRYKDKADARYQWGGV